MSRPIPPALYALKAWTIKRVGDKFFVAPSTAFGNKPNWSKAYASLQAACAAIARNLAEEWTGRHMRHRKLRRLARER